MDNENIITNTYDKYFCKMHVRIEKKTKEKSRKWHENTYLSRKNEEKYKLKGAGANDRD